MPRHMLEKPGDITAEDLSSYARHAGRFRAFFKVFNKNYVLFAALALFALFAALALPGPALAGTPSQAFEIIIPHISKTEVNQLARNGINITNRHDATAWAYVTQDQFQQILDRGYAAEIVVPEVRKTATKLGTDYPTYAEVVAELDRVANTNPGICKVVDIGQAHSGERSLLFLKISDNVNTEEDEPEFKYISTMHGNEPIGTDLMLKLINYLVDNYATDSRVTNLVNNMEIWIMPLMNPDGYENSSRRNLQYDEDHPQGYDLNRNFPERTGDNVNTLVNIDGNPRPTEVQRIMSWAFDHSSVLSANFHTGAVVANYPYDSKMVGDAGDADHAETPDDDLFIQLALTYASNSTRMSEHGLTDSGIINGYDWYLITGGMQDWNYVWMGCMEITIELSNDFAPSFSLMGDYWNDNRESLLAYMEWALRGVRGIVTDKNTGQPISATITVNGSDFQVYTDPDVGDYHRILLPSDQPYTLTISADGYETQVISGVIVQEGDATCLDVELDLLPSNFNCNEGPDIGDAVIALQILAGMTPEIGVCADARPVSGVQIGQDDALFILQQIAQMP